MKPVGVRGPANVVANGRIHSRQLSRLFPKHSTIPACLVGAPRSKIANVPALFLIKSESIADSGILCARISGTHRPKS